MKQTFTLQHMAFIKGIQVKASEPKIVSPPERFVSIPTEPEENEDLMHHWQNFVEGGGDSTIDLIDVLNDAFLSEREA